MEIIDLEMIPGGPKKTCHASQFDNGRVIRFNLKENGQPFALSGSESVQAIIRKPDGSETTLDIANTESTYVDLITEEDTCDLAGVNHCEMKVTEDGEDLGSGNFDMKVEEDAYGAGDVSVGTASGPIASFETDIKDDLIECVCEINPVQDLHGEDKPYPAGGGVNIWDEEWENGGISEADGSTFANPNTIRSKNYIPCTPNTDFYYYCGSGDLAFRICYYDSNKNFISCEVIIPTNRIYQTPANCAFIKIGMRDTYGTTYKNDISINNPSTDHDYHPYENVCPIEGHTEMDIIRSGVNLFDGTWEIGHRWEGDGTYTSTFIGSRNAGTPNKIPCKPNTTYAFIMNNIIQTTYMYLSEFDVNENHIQKGSNISISTSTKYVTFTTGANTYFIAFSLYANTDFTSTEVSKTGINYPSTDHTYHPAEIIKKNIQLGQTVYKGKHNVTNGQGENEFEIIDLGDLNWVYYQYDGTGKGGGYTQDLITSVKKPASETEKTGALSEGLKEFTDREFNSIKTSDAKFAINIIGNIKVSLHSATDAADLKTKLTGIRLCYPKKITDSIQATPTNIETLVGENNVYHTANGDTAVKFYTRA